MHSFSCPALVTWIGFASQFCNSYLRSAPSSGGMVSLGGFVVFWGWIFVLTTVAVWLGKKEVPDGARKEEGGDYGMVDSAERGDPAEEAEPNLGVAGTYRAMWLVLHKPAVRSLCVILLTCKVRTAPAAANRRRRPLPQSRLSFLACLRVRLNTRCTAMSLQDTRPTSGRRSAGDTNRCLHKGARVA